MGCKIGKTTDVGMSYVLHNVSDLSTQGYVSDLIVSGSTVFLAEGAAGIRAVDVSNPFLPYEKAYNQNIGIVREIKFEGRDYIYAACESDGFKIIDINSPFGFEVVGSYETENAMGLDFRDRYLYLADGIDGVRILDVSIPFSINELSRISVSGQIAYSVTANLPYLYVSSKYGFSIINVDNPLAPVEVHYEIMGEVRDIAISSHYAFVAFDGGLKIFNISNPQDPLELGFIFLPAPAKGITIRGEFAYLAIGNGGISIVRITNPSQIYETAYYIGQNPDMNKIRIAGSYLFIANGGEGMKILDFNAGL